MNAAFRTTQNSARSSCGPPDKPRSVGVFPHHQDRAVCWTTESETLPRSVRRRPPRPRLPITISSAPSSSASSKISASGRPILRCARVTPAPALPGSAARPAGPLRDGRYILASPDGKSSERNRRGPRVAPSPPSLRGLPLSGPPLRPAGHRPRLPVSSPEGHPSLVPFLAVRDKIRPEGPRALSQFDGLPGQDWPFLPVVRPNARPFSQRYPSLTERPFS